MAEPARYGRNRRDYRRKAARMRRQGGVCWICGEPIDPNLPYLHPMAGTADHVHTLATGGHVLGELRPAHRSCNARRGDGTSTKAKPPKRSSAF